MVAVGTEHSGQLAISVLFILPWGLLGYVAVPNNVRLENYSLNQERIPDLHRRRCSLETQPKGDLSIGLDMPEALCMGRMELQAHQYKAPLKRAT